MVYTYHKIYNPEEQAEIKCECEKGGIGCVACKKRLAAKLNEYMEPIRERREHFAGKPQQGQEILQVSKKPVVKRLKLWRWCATRWACK